MVSYARFWGVVRELLIESQPVIAHKRQGTRGLVEETQATLENRNCISHWKSILKYFLLINIYILVNDE